MTRAKGGLGRGLAALIPTGPSTTTVSDVLLGGDIRSAENGGPVTRTAGRPAAPSGPETATGDPTRATPPEPGFTWNDSGGTSDGPRYVEVSIDLIDPNPRNPRTVFDEDAMVELVHSIREFGLLQPIVVRPAGRRYELVMGERRWRAAERAGLTAVPAIVRRVQDADLLRDALLENIHRANLNPLEEAAAYQQLLEEFDVTHEELAGRLGRSRPVISNTIRLLKLPVAVQRRVAAGVLSAGHARALLALDDPAAQEELAVRIVAEGLSVRGTEEAVTLAARSRRPSRRPATRKPGGPGLEHLATSLSDVFDTRVLVDVGRRKGRIMIEFAGLDDLERIVAIMAPELQREAAGVVEEAAAG
jgi:ParB family chromosome partitioning protein